MTCLEVPLNRIDHKLSKISTKVTNQESLPNQVQKCEIFFELNLTGKVQPKDNCILNNLLVYEQTINDSIRLTL